MPAIPVMKPIRNVSFGQMTTIEVFRVLVAGEMPDGTKIDNDTRKASLSRILPMIQKDFWCGDATFVYMKDHHPFDQDTLYYDALRALIEKAKDILE